ncbi:MAG: thioesterase family protein [Candidatus Aadella gelida]|nr:thioesterase family protein [Candidatus Aadella gelida]
MREHTIEHRVNYKETDQMGFVYYANYLVWFEIARTEMFRANGMCYKGLEEEGLFLPVTEAQCRYRSPVRYDDIVKVKAIMTDIRKSRITFEYEVTKEGKTTSMGYTKHAFIDKAGKVVPVPSKVRDM